MARIFKHYNVFITPLAGNEQHVGITKDDTLKVVDGFLLFEQKETHNRMGINASAIAFYRLEPEFIDATKNT
ncbi:TPA: hypothetical protein ACSW2U_001704 [Enterobacter roggenkampii]